MNDDRFDDEELNEDEGAFADMFEASLATVGQPLQRGKKIEATLLGLPQPAW